MPDAWRAYLEMALGLTEAPRKRAQKVAGELVNRGGATAAQLQGLVDDLMSVGMANREALTNIVRYEVDKALGVVGLATAEEVIELTDRVRDLERQLRDAESRAEGGAGAPESEIGGTRLDEPAPMPRKVAKKAVATKAVATKAVARKTAPAKAIPPPDEVIPAAKRATAKAAPATVEAERKRTPAARKAVAKKTAPAGDLLPPAKKAAAKRTPARKATPPSFVEPRNPEA